jgi:uncharacterized cupredoxin-like copper-binding protein
VRGDRPPALALTLALTLALGTPQAALAHGKDHAHGGGKAAVAKKEQKPWGIAGDAKAVTRTVELSMGDDMRFKPDRLEVREGETLRLVVRNTGKLMHEIVIGTKAELDAHAALMKKHPNMAHDEPYMAHVAPGKRGELIWHFNRAGEFDFACLIPGHYDAGMRGTVSVRAARP